MKKPTDYIKKFEVNGKTVYIIADDCAENPRDEHCNMWNIVSNRHSDITAEGDLTLEELMDSCNRKRLEMDYMIVPVYAHIHSGTALSLNPFNDPWDSGIGYMAYVSKRDLYKEYNAKRVAASVRRRALSVLKGEMEEFEAYLNGNVYGFQIFDEADNLIDSCYGFYDMEYAEEMAKAEAKVA